MLDLCRQSIYFDSIAAIADCVAVMAADPEVALARVKNRFASGTGDTARVTAGFRNVAVNLRLSTEESRASGAATHLCEVQLLLIRMAAIKVRARVHRMFSPVLSP